MTSTVQQLIEKLQQFPPDTVIILEDEIGDEFSLDSMSIADNQLVIKIEGENDERTRIDEGDES
ncbi:MAG: hypothetical protein PUP90_02335 [Nostoc sp. S4]|nr:hypothetical protein [Nostoc sp. S4]